MTERIDGNLDALNRHEAAETLAEELYDAKRVLFDNAIIAPVIYYKTDPAPSIEDATRIAKAFHATLGDTVQVIYHNALPNDTDYLFTGIDKRVGWIIKKLCEEIICNGFTAEYAEKFVNEKIGEIETQ
mgnify:CR=1 FL=1